MNVMMVVAMVLVMVVVAALLVAVVMTGIALLMLAMDVVKTRFAGSSRASSANRFPFKACFVPSCGRLL